MPNYETNRLTIIGEHAEEIIKSHCKKNADGGLEIDEYTGEPVFDFNTIIPMPESLNVVSGSITDECMRLFINGMLEGCEAFEKYAAIYREYDKTKFRLSKVEMLMPEEDFNRRVEELLKYYGKPDDEPCFKTKADIFAYGKRALDNFKEYGCVDWYDWCRKNWGTKWNAQNTNIRGNSVWFDTPWCPVFSIVERLAELHPDCEILYEFAEEQTGVRVGWVSYKNGKVVDSEDYEDFSKEAYEQAFMLLGGREDYEYNDKEKTYNYIGS